MQLKMYDTELFAAIKYTAITSIAAIFGMINLQGVIAALQPFSYLVTICAGFMAIRHWYYATKKINDKK